MFVSVKMCRVLFARAPVLGLCFFVSVKKRSVRSRKVGPPTCNLGYYFRVNPTKQETNLFFVLGACLCKEKNVRPLGKYEGRAPTCNLGLDFRVNLTNPENNLLCVLGVCLCEDV